MKFEHLVKKTAIAGLLAAPLLISSSINNAQAQEVVSSHDTNLEVEFITPDDTVDVIDPETEEPISPEDDPGVSEQSGPLTLDYAPYIDFGTHEISSGDFNMTLAEAHGAHATLQAESEEAIRDLTNERMPFVQVSDRRGNGNGWNVQVSLSEFDTGALQGATLTFGSANEVVGVNGTQATPEGDNVPSAAGFKVTTGAAADLVMDAQVNQGRGSWQARWEKDNVELFIPGNNIDVGHHVATLSWNLTDAPQ